jgi:hypothetical protein
VTPSGQLALAHYTHCCINYGPVSTGARLVVVGSVARLVSTTGATTWTTPAKAVNYPVHLVLGNDGKLSVAVYGGNAWTPDYVIWHS